MFRNLIRWIVPIVALLLIATVLVLSPVLSSIHAAGTHHAIHQVDGATPTPGGMTPDWGWQH